MDRLLALLDQLAPESFGTLSDRELAELRTDVEEAILEAGEGELTAQVTAAMKTAATAVQQIAAEQTDRTAIAAQLRADADAAMADVRALSQDEGDGAGDAGGEGGAEAAAAGGNAGDGGGGDDATTTGGGAEGDAGDGSGDGGGEAAGGDGGEAAGGETSAAAAPRAPMRREVTSPARNRPHPVTRRAEIVASGEVRGVAPGHRFNHIDELTEAMYDRWSTMRTSADGQMHYMGTIDYGEMYPEERRLRSADPNEVSDQVMREVNRRNEVFAAARLKAGGGTMDSLVASGGIPGPAEPRYAQITYGQARRPLRDALPAFLANRGQIIFNESPTLADIVLDQSGGAVGTVTNAQDIAGATKTIQEISAPSSTTVTVEAEVLRFSQGNFADRFYPERTRAFLALGQVAFARHNEMLRLADIKSGSVKWTDTPAKFGAYRDLKRAFLATTEEIEDVVRDFEQPLRVLMPEYVPSLLAADLVAQGFGDSGWQANVEAMRADMRTWNPNVNITFLYDSIRGRLSTTPSGQSPRSPGFDADVEWCIFPEGTWLYLDGGQLDLGIIRDSATSQLNKFQTFFEQWEAVARIAPLSFWLTSSLCASGVAQIPVTVADCLGNGS